jgi:ankyrin repeat protein
VTKIDKVVVVSAGLVLYLAAAGCTSRRDVALVDAALSGELPKVQSLLKEGANIEATAYDGLTPLDAAAKEGHLAVVEYLVASGAAVNGVAHSNRTPLGTAFVYEREDCVKYLVSHGGEIRSTPEWREGLLASLKRDNRTELYQLARQQIDKEGGAEHPAVPSAH